MRHAIAIVILGTVIGCSADRVISPAPQPRAEIARLCIDPHHPELGRYPCGPPPVFIVDGTRRASVDDIDAKRIHSIEVLKGPEAVRRYGEDARGGAILITLMER